MMQQYPKHIHLSRHSSGIRSYSIQKPLGMVCEQSLEARLEQGSCRRNYEGAEEESWVQQA